MATITKFEDLEIWKLARDQSKDLCDIEKGSLSKDFSLRNQMISSSGSVMDCIAEGFERSGNAEFKNFLIIAKGSNGEYRSQLYRCLDRNHITKEKFDKLFYKNINLGKNLIGFIRYLSNSSIKGQRYKQESK